MTPLPKSLQEAIESGKLTQAQLRELITLEAEAIGLTCDNAIRLAKEGRLPKSSIGLDIDLLVELLAA